MVRPREYINNPGISQSDITMFEKNIAKFYRSFILGEEQEDKKTDSMDLGSVVDNILLFKENLKNYYVLTEFKASGKEKEIVDMVAVMVAAQIQQDITDNKTRSDAMIMKNWPELKMFEKEIVAAYESINWQPKWLRETKIAKIKEHGAEYFEQLKEAEGKYIVPIDIWNTAHSLIDQIKDDESTSGIFKMIRGEMNNAQKLRYKVQKTVALSGIEPVTGSEVKGLLDLYIDDTKQKIISPWDIKTAKSLALFLNNYRTYRYGRQGAFYRMLLQLKYPEYIINPFQFLVIPTVSGEAPEIFRMSDSEIIANTNGAESPNGYRIKGFREFLIEIKWHRENNKWLHHKDYYEKRHNLITGNLNVDPGLLVDESEVIF